MGAGAETTPLCRRDRLLSKRGAIAPRFPSKQMLVTPLLAVLSPHDTISVGAHVETL